MPTQISLPSSSTRKTFTTAGAQSVTHTPAEPVPAYVAVCVQGGNQDFDATVTYGGVALTKKATYRHGWFGTGDVRSMTYVLEGAAIPGGAQSVVVTTTATVVSGHFVVYSGDSESGGASVAASAQRGGLNAVTGQTMDPGAADAVAIACWANASAGSNMAVDYSLSVDGNSSGSVARSDAVTSGSRFVGPGGIQTSAAFAAVLLVDDDPIPVEAEIVTRQKVEVGHRAGASGNASVDVGAYMGQRERVVVGLRPGARLTADSPRNVALVGQGTDVAEETGIPAAVGSGEEDIPVLVYRRGERPSFQQLQALIDALGVGGATDHGALTGLADDDHPQYETAAEVAAQISTHASDADAHHSLAAPVVRVYTSDDTWTKPASLSHIVVEVQGGGAGGGGAVGTGSSTVAASGGGGGGGYARKLFTAADLAGLSTATVTVGAGGSGGLSSGTDGDDGDDSSFAGTGITTVSGGGGSKGAGDASASSGNSIEFGGQGGAASGGDVNVGGTPGGEGFTQAGLSIGTNPYGGASYLGGQQGANTFDADGQDGLAYGGGGSGVRNGVSDSAHAGGDGAAGAVIVTEYYG